MPLAALPGRDTSGGPVGTTADKPIYRQGLKSHAELIATQGDEKMTGCDPGAGYSSGPPWASLPGNGQDPAAPSIFTSGPSLPGEFTHASFQRGLAGFKVRRLIVYLHAGQFLSKDRTALALAELFGIPCSSGRALDARCRLIRPPRFQEVMRCVQTWMFCKAFEAHCGLRGLALLTKVRPRVP